MAFRRSLNLRSKRQFPFVRLTHQAWCLRRGLRELWRLPKVLSSYPLSPQRGERVRVRGEEKTFGNEYSIGLLSRVAIWEQMWQFYP